jgi:cell fate regulator YaaT (PSP1 superfamily)
MCCLKYEQEAYEEVLARVPRAGAIVKTVDGQGTVIYVSLLKEILKVKLDGGNDHELKPYFVKDVEVIKDMIVEDHGHHGVDLEHLKKLED